MRPSFNPLLYLTRLRFVTPEYLTQPADGPELVLHLGHRGYRRSRRRLGLYPRLMRDFQKRRIKVVAVEVSAEARQAARADNRFHIFYHGRFQGPRFLNFKSGHLRGYFYCDPQGFGGFSAIADTVYEPPRADRTEIDAFYEALRRKWVLGRNSKFRQPDPGTPLPQNAIVLFLQIRRDVVLRLARHSIEDMTDMLLAERGGKPLLIKRHPKCNDPQTAAMLARLHAPDRGVHVVDANLHDMIDAASHVAVVNSGTGFEALLHGKPVLTFGQADYQHATWPIHSPADLRVALQADTPPIEDMPAYLWWYLREQMLAQEHDDMAARICARVRAMGYPLDG